MDQAPEGFRKVGVWDEAPPEGFRKVASAPELTARERQRPPEGGPPEPMGVGAQLGWGNLAAGAGGLADLLNLAGGAAKDVMTHGVPTRGGAGPLVPGEPLASQALSFFDTPEPLTEGEKIAATGTQNLGASLALGPAFGPEATAVAGAIGYPAAAAGETVREEARKAGAGPGTQAGVDLITQVATAAILAKSTSSLLGNPEVKGLVAKLMGRGTPEEVIQAHPTLESLNAAAEAKGLEPVDPETFFPPGLAKTAASEATSPIGRPVPGPELESALRPTEALPSWEDIFGPNQYIKPGTGLDELFAAKPSKLQPVEPSLEAPARPIEGLPEASGRPILAPQPESLSPEELRLQDLRHEVGMKALAELETLPETKASALLTEAQRSQTGAKSGLKDIALLRRAGDYLNLKDSAKAAIKAGVEPEEWASKEGSILDRWGQAYYRDVRSQIERFKKQRGSTSGPERPMTPEEQAAAKATAAAAAAQANLVDDFYQKAAEKVRARTKQAVDEISARTGVTPEKDLGAAVFAADSAPDKVFGDVGEVKGFTKAAGEFHGFISLPVNKISNPVWQRYWAAVRNKATNTGFMASRLEKQIDEWAVRHGIKGENPDLFYAIEGLETGPDGFLRQTRPDAAPEWDAAAREHQVMMDRVWVHNMGIEPRAVALVRQLGLPEEPKLWRLLQAVQRDPAILETIDPRSKFGPFKDAVQIAAERTKGMLTFDDTYDLKPVYQQGFYSHRPVENLRAYLEDKLAETHDKMGAMGLSSEEIADYEANIGEITGKLRSLEARAERAPGVSPFVEIPPRSRFDAHWNIARLPGASDLGINLDAVQVAKTHMKQAMHKRLMDYALYGAKDTIDALGDRRSKRYVLDWLAGIRGVRGLNENQAHAAIYDGVANAVRTTLGREATEIKPYQFERFFRGIMKTQLFRKLYTPRQLVVNTTQTPMTVWPFVPEEIYGAAEAKGSIAAVAHSASKRGMSVPEAVLEPWQRAHSNAALTGPEYYLHEIGSEDQGGALGGLAEAASKPQGWTELRNRVVAHEAFYQHAMSPGFKPVEYFKRFMSTEAKQGTEEYALSYARAGVDATQFVYETLGRPVSFVGGAARRSATQFQSFGVSYSALMYNALKSGDVVGFGKMLTALWVFGGLRAAARPIVVYPLVAALLLKKGIVLPERSGLSYLSEALDMGAAPIDVTGSIDPFPDPERYTDVSNLNPLFSDIGGVVRAGAQAYGENYAGAAKTAVRTVSPWLNAIGESAVEAEQGGVFTSAKHPKELADRGPWWVASRALNLSPSASFMHSDYQEHIRTALEGGQTRAAVDLAEEAQRKYGLEFGAKDFRAIQGGIKEKRRRGTINQWEDVFSPK